MAEEAEFYNLVEAVNLNLHFQLSFTVLKPSWKCKLNFQNKINDENILNRAQKLLGFWGEFHLKFISIRSELKPVCLLLWHHRCKEELAIGLKSPFGFQFYSR